MRRSLVFGLVLTLGFVAGQVFSADEPRVPSEEVMKALEKYGTPGAEHEWLKQFEGSWDVRIRATMDASQPMREANGRAEDKVVLNGLFLQEQFDGQCPFTGKKVHAIAFTGFDNAKKKYVQCYLDSLGSGILVGEGTADDAKKTITTHATRTDPVTGESRKLRAVLKVVDEKKAIYEEYLQDKDGREFRALEMIYTRK